MVEITDTIQSPSVKHLLDKLKVGESFSVENGREISVRHAAWRYYHSVEGNDKLFTVRRDPVDGKNFRCWRDK